MSAACADRKKIYLGDGGDPEMIAAIRAHGNLIEFAPLCLLLIYLAERLLRLLAPSPSWRIMLLLAARAACRRHARAVIPLGRTAGRRRHDDRCWRSPRSCSSLRASSRGTLRRARRRERWASRSPFRSGCSLAIAAFALWSLLDRLLIPSGRWFLRRRLNRLIDRVNRRLAVEIKPFQLTKRQVLIDRLVYDPQVVAAANEHARANNLPREVAMAEVQRYAREIVPTFNAYIYFRVGYSLARAVARSSSIACGWASPTRRTLAGVAPGTTVVFVMNHRSNMDYVLVAFLAAERTALSYAVGEWARIWPLQQLIRSMGAYFVRRNSNNPIYRRVLERYVHMATEAGVAQAMYPEGGLSRDGRLREPKLGLLDYMLKSFDPQGRRTTSSSCRWR